MAQGAPTTDLIVLLLAVGLAALGSVVWWMVS